ncbi:MAG: hypothetical protein V1725_07225 [archaeon]
MEPNAYTIQQATIALALREYLALQELNPKHELLYHLDNVTSRAFSYTDYAKFCNCFGKEKEGMAPIFGRYYLAMKAEVDKVRGKSPSFLPLPLEEQLR